MAEKNSIDDKVRLVRGSRKLSVEQLAERADLRMEVVGRIESGALIPSLGPLIRIARALGVRLGTFLDDQENVGPVVVRSGERRKVMHVSDKSHPARNRRRKELKVEAQVKQEHQAEIEAGRRAAVREMTFTQGWNLFSTDAEDALMQAMMAILATDPMDPAAPAKIAYWRGRVDAIKSVFLWEIDMTAEGQEDKELKSQGLAQSLKHLIRKLIWRA